VELAKCRDMSQSVINQVLCKGAPGVGSPAIGRDFFFLEPSRTGSENTFDGCNPIWPIRLANLVLHRGKGTCNLFITMTA
jgi:hypothetical protein